MKHETHHRFAKTFFPSAGPLIGLVLLFFVLDASAQDICPSDAQATYYTSSGLMWNPASLKPFDSSSTPDSTSQSFSLKSTIWLPEYARENPSGNSFLCRVETSLESKMTVPVWIRAGEMPMLPQAGGSNIYLRVKLIRF